MSSLDAVATPAVARIAKPISTSPTATFCLNAIEEDLIGDVSVLYLKALASLASRIFCSKTDSH